MKAKPEGVFEDLMLLESTGKEFYANKGIIGLNRDLEIFEGYDGGINQREFTKQEREELSDYMIDLWQAFKLKP
jgi:hypothetical protein